VSYLSTVQADNPLHYWRIGEAGGSLLHDIGSAPLALGLLPIAATNLGYSGPASDGGSVWVDTGWGWTILNSIGGLALPFSVELWYWPINSNATVEWLFDWGGSAGSGVDVVLVAAGFVGADVGTTHIQGVAIPTRQAWHHVVVTAAVGAMNLYVDGAAAAAGVPLGALAAGSINIGRSNTGGSWSAGCIGEVATYSAALSAGRVAAHFAAADSRTSPPVYNQLGAFQRISGSTQILSGQLGLVTDGVIRTWSNVP
jgi:Concanavalin A-like lectin/glucanases superfamily